MLTSGLYYNQLTGGDMLNQSTWPESQLIVSNLKQSCKVVIEIPVEDFFGEEEKNKMCDVSPC